LPDKRRGYTGASGKIQSFADGAALFLDFLLQQRDRVDQLLRAWWASGNIDIDWDHLIHTLHQRIVLKHATRSRARAHRHNPFGFRHLLPELANHWGHLVGNATGNDHKVTLAGRRTEHLGAEASDVETRGSHRHHFNRAASQAEGHGPNGTLAHPVDGGIERGQYHTFGRGIAERQVSDDLFAVFDFNIRTEIEFARHYGFILNHRGDGNIGVQFFHASVESPLDLLQPATADDTSNGAGPYSKAA